MIFILVTLFIDILGLGIMMDIKLSSPSCPS